MPSSSETYLSRISNSVSTPTSMVGAHVQTSSLSAVQSIVVPDNAEWWIVQVQTKNVRFTLDGTTPTSTKGFRLTAGNDLISIAVSPGMTIKAIEESATAVMDYQFASDAL